MCPSLGLLRRHVGGRPQDRHIGGEGCVAFQADEPVVADVGLSPIIKQDVRGLEVPVDDSIFVPMVDTLGNLLDDGRRLSRTEGTSPQHFCETAPWNQLIGDVCRFRLEAAVVDRHVTRGMTVVDVGAHTGYYALLFAKRVGRAGRVIAFEPEAVGLDYLRRNVALNEHENVTIVPLALSDWSGSAAIEGKTYLCAPSIFADARDHASDRSDAAGLALRRAERIEATPAADNPIRTAAFDELVPELGVT